MWSWLGYMNPHRLTWGPGFDFPFVQTAAITTLIGFAYLATKEGRIPSFQWRRETVLLLLLWLIFTITTIFSLQPDYAWPEFWGITKILLMTFMTIVLIDDERKYRILLLVIAVSIGFYGVKGGIYSILSGGHSTVLGPVGRLLKTIQHWELPLT